MEEVATTRRSRRPVMGRRPFLAPIWLTALIVALVVAAALVLYQSAATTTVVVVRPGEPMPGDAPDRPLVSAGEQRAERLAELFGGTSSPGRIAAIYVTAARRAQQMALPLAARLRIQPIVVADDDAGRTASRALNEHRGEAVMVIAPAATVPTIVEALSGIKVAPLTQGEYGDIYIVSVPIFGSAGLVQLHY